MQIRSPPSLYTADSQAAAFAAQSRPSVFPLNESAAKRDDFLASQQTRLGAAAAWRDITDSAYVLQAVQGYLLDFHTRPPIMAARQANAVETTMNSGKAELLDADVTPM